MLAKPDSPAIGQILANPHHVGYMVLINAMSRSQHDGIMRLLLDFFDDPQAPMPMLNVAAIAATSSSSAVSCTSRSQSFRRRATESEAHGQRRLVAEQSKSRRRPGRRRPAQSCIFRNVPGHSAAASVFHYRTRFAARQTQRTARSRPRPWPPSTAPTPINSRSKPSATATRKSRPT